MREQPLTNEDLHPVLAELPVFEPAADLWPRILAKREGPQRAVRRPRRLAAIAAVAAVVVATVLIVPRMATVPALSAGQIESQTLEREWQALPAASTRGAADVARLHVIDTALQAAYDRGAHADELQPLWQQRNQALRGLIISARSDAVTRI
ncbi:MAG: hypothetical protein ACREPX_09205 [Rhodanobacteraceae bacterium]